MFGVTSIFSIAFLTLIAGGGADECRSIASQVSIIPVVERATEVLKGLVDQPDLHIANELKACLEAVPVEYLNHPTFRDLVTDPDRKQVSAQTIREAMAAIQAIRSNVIESDIRRAPANTHADFFDASETPIDIKTPVSPKTHETWVFELEPVVQSILKAVDRAPSPPLYKDSVIILDTTYLIEADRSALDAALVERLSAMQLQRIHRIELIEPIRSKIRSYRVPGL